MPSDPVLITTSELAELIDSGRSPVLLDVRWALGDEQGRDRFHEGHIPGAVFVDLDAELADPPTPKEGRHPLPAIVRLQDCARRWGISGAETVVAYDATGGLAAARAWWLLRWAGLTTVRLLDGGLPAWIAGGHPVAAGPGGQRHPGTVTLQPGHMKTVDIDTVAGLPSHGTLLDARAAERYRGEEEPVDRRAGHIPGAVSAPTTDNLREDGSFRPADQLAARFAALGVTGDVAVYCGSGVTAAHEIAALAIAGIDAALFPGSWSQWSADPTREAATGG
ncbi:sulfurtransferase [Rhodococcus chondri]|uniref:Sulfurtransferase n=1 Tax=Rhodococcus chondri TaxID=3065941 RepID=A0ABU7JVV4_9NOCA|nr:sulfurtransferase [Rhodococcus sp. CC-R104]MEE2034125.1 sulfurtransferase [Rhodococcus sp. CC-R104]